jgi:hypothetical protein
MRVCSHRFIILTTVGGPSLQVTTDIYDDAERQNLVLDETVRLAVCFSCFLLHN